MEDLFIGFMKTIGALTVIQHQIINAVKMFLMGSFVKQTVWTSKMIPM